MKLQETIDCRSWAKLALVLCCLATAPALARADEPNASARDGARDFDFDIGVWHTHIRRILDPFAGGQHVIELDGVVTVSKVWDGRASLEEIEVDGPTGHWEGMNLFLYNPVAHQWSQSYSNSKVGTIGAPFVGEFRNGRGELISPDTLDNRAVLVRAVWSNIETNAHDYSESYSEDGGATWQLSFAAHLIRAAS
ncbi:MAG TPA: hypothetical protein VGV37_04130 [Aliidongia sp.]|uniref:hypothetical protein n=1 Tax=Aliidongia sp. TaxID=1914230 RepID=UPI002DDD0F44|nr:hypothetical protein [Aliidongia sp.]HEV2673704.1 hypothetical protein [Aliidongia sp.]